MAAAFRIVSPAYEGADLDDQTQHLHRLRGLLETAAGLVDELAADVPISEDARIVLAVAADAITTAKPRTRKEIRHFAEAITRGDEAWLVVHSVPGKNVIEAFHLAKMSAATKRALGI